MVTPAWITFLSDYGLEDTCVGVCHGVIARHAPGARVLDLCHAVAPQDVQHGAGLLADSIAYLPTGVHLAVVERLDGSGRPRGVAVRTADGSTFVAPDNGLTSLAWDLLGGVTAAYEIANRELWLPLPSAVFRGRDVYAPVAARLAAGLPLTEVGPQIDPATLDRLAWPRCSVDDDHVHAEVLGVDHFGNLSLNVASADLEAAGMLRGDRVEVRAAGRQLVLPFTHTYRDVPVGQPVLCEDALRRVMLAVNCGRAADLLRLGRRDPLVIGQVPREKTVVGRGLGAAVGGAPGPRAPAGPAR
ncbi:MAG: SAM-dependent chlorinase/fluorinase [Frankia sp.]|nr:SAM-dependent chlorinase/fluorinase [Frankia sp.]